MDWDKLRIFHMVAEAGSFTHAGEALQLSQSAVSRQISSLEDSLGVTLFHRHARGLILTEQGELLHKTSRDIVAKLKMIEGQLLDSKDQAEGSLTITVADFIGTEWLAGKIAAFQKLYPKIKLTLLLEDRVLNLGMREADAAIRLYKPEQPDLIQRHVTSMHFAICASTKYLTQKGRPKDLKSLKDHSILCYPSSGVVPYLNPNWLLERANIIANDNPKTIQINSVSAQLKAAKSGLGVAVLPRFLVAGDKDLEIILPSIKSEPIDMFFVYPEERRHSRRIALFRDFILKSVQDLPF
jgi:DNA-binding transcriptional LysR family regulator